MDLDERIRLSEAAEYAKVSVSTLRLEVQRGKLVVWRLGNKDWTTRREIDRMIDKCQIKPKAQDSGSSQPTSEQTVAPVKPAGSSEMERVRLAQAAALALAKKLKSGSLNTSRKNTSRPDPVVVPLRPSR